MRVAFALFLLVLVSGCSEPEPEPTLDVSAVLSGDTAGYARATEQRAFRFPDDHGPHPAFKTEWWYFTGNLEAASGEPYGFQLTFFRSALAPDTIATAPWRARDAYMAHFALTDGVRGRFHAFERFSRAAAGLAGARSRPFRVWLDDWFVRATGEGAVPEMTLSASQGDVAVELRLRAHKPPVLQGEDGLSRKGSTPGNASYYYSLTRLRADGEVTVGSAGVPVSGWVWMDREWSTSVLEDEQAGWDWFALQLDDSTDVMVYHLRRRDGAPDPFSRGVVIDERGGKSGLLPEQFQLEVLDRWTSPRGVSYPSRWRLRVPGHSLDVIVEPVIADQELNLSFRYWEGAVRVEGTHGARSVSGVGYVELTGYVTQ